MRDGALGGDGQSAMDLPGALVAAAAALAALVSRIARSMRAAHAE